MNKKTTYRLIAALFVLCMVMMLGFFAFRLISTFQKPTESAIPLPATPTQPPQVVWKSINSFRELPGWDDAILASSFNTLMVSCDVFLRQLPEKEVGSDYLPLDVRDWQPVCRAAKKMIHPSEVELKAFFESWFDVGTFYQADADNTVVEGLFTGYYVPVIEGSLQKKDDFNVPIYGLPSNWVSFRLHEFDSKLPDRKIVGRVEGHHVYPFHTRAEINRGAIEKHAPVIAWISNQVDRLFLEIQGSGIIQLPDKSEIFIGYAGQNGAAYTSIASILIKEGVLTQDSASMQNIRAYFKAHPDKMQDIIEQNESFVFFEKQQKAAARGAQGVYLTPGYSLAVDRTWVPLGTPIWLDTLQPTIDNHQQPLQRLFIAQDTGGAIKGPVRGDVFWGKGEQAGAIAGKMKNKGNYWLFLPREKPRT